MPGRCRVCAADGAEHLGGPLLQPVYQSHFINKSYWHRPDHRHGRDAHEVCFGACVYGAVACLVELVGNPPG